MPTYTSPYKSKWDSDQDDLPPKMSNLKFSDSDSGAAEAMLCSANSTIPPQHDGTAAGDRLEAIMTNKVKWISGTTLYYYLYPIGEAHRDGYNLGPPASKRSWLDVIRRAFQLWMDTGMSIKFSEVDKRSDADITVSFTQNGRSYSYVGRDNITYGSSKDHTMNIGWDLDTNYGFETCVHEIGHALGLSHEHQNPKAGIHWNESEVLRRFSGPPNNWDPNRIRHNILNKISDPVSGSKWDKASVMHYSFGPGLIATPEDLRLNGIQPQKERAKESGSSIAPVLSKTDIKTILELYPPENNQQLNELKLGESWTVNVDPGEQVHFVFKPERTIYSRKYNFTTFGSADTYMVIFEKTDFGEVLIAEDDDSGWRRNALISMRLITGRTYIVRLRLYSRFDSDTFGVIVF